MKYAAAALAGLSMLAAATYLAEVGVSIPLMPRLSLVPAYRYSNIFRGTIAESAAKVGLRYSF